MSDLSQTLTLEEEFLEVESEYGGCTWVGTDIESSDIENEQSQYPYFLLPSHDFDTSAHDDYERAAIEDFEYKCKLWEDSTPCCKTISIDLIINYRSSCLELSKDEVDFVFLGRFILIMFHPLPTPIIGKLIIVVAISFISSPLV